MNERRRGRLAEPRRVGAPDAGHAAKAEGLDIGAQQRARFGAVIDEQGETRAARQGLDRQRARAGEQIDDPRAFEPSA